mmetsp:Transcript_29087/g.63159  ORF Transcript_29087/g.63159 Transcript_29087/m.63159 type:complete len:105 (+) Transcript_29087:43-357(+)
MLGRTALTASRVAVRRSASAQPAAAAKGQRRTFIDYLTNYPDRVQEIKKVQMKGGTCQGEANPTWLKQPGDKGVALFGLGLTTFGVLEALIGHYRLATGKGKMD